MSHYLIGVLVPASTIDFESAIEPLLAPYNENIEVDQYEKQCYCINRAAMLKARNNLFKVHSNLEQKQLELRSLQQKLWSNCPNESVLTKIEQDNLEQEWEALQLQCDQAQNKLAMQDPAYQKPDVSCEQCQGSGKDTSTYNPNSKWDWYQIGGRWSGEFAIDYDPTADPVNIEDCTSCNATGLRPDTNKPCHGCEATGKKLKWPTKWVEAEGNIAPISKVRDYPEMYPFAIVLPSGEWVEKGKMGWFGMSADKVTAGEWQTVVTTIFDQYPDHLIVAVDAHI